MQSTLSFEEPTVLVQNNPGSLPYLSPGKNVVSVALAEPTQLGENKLVVTYAYAPGFRAKPLAAAAV